MRIIPLCILGILAFSVTSALAGVIPVGLDWRKDVFVQEVWIDAVPSWTIANLGKEPVNISVFEQKAEQPTAGPWIIPAGGVVTPEVKSLVGKNLVTVKPWRRPAIDPRPGPSRPARRSRRRERSSAITASTASGGKPDEAVDRAAEGAGQVGPGLRAHAQGSREERHDSLPAAEFARLD